MWEKVEFKYVVLRMRKLSDGFMQWNVILYKYEAQQIPKVLQQVKQLKALKGYMSSQWMCQVYKT